jgi:predicted dehydrogenase
MAYLDWLDQQLSARLNAGAVGRVVFIRAHLALSADHGLLVPLASGGLDLAERWIKTPVRRVYAQGGVRSGFVSLLAEFEQGQTALVTAEAAGAEASALLLVTGQRGTLRFDDYPEPDALVDTAGTVGRRWPAAIAGALASGKQFSGLP